MIYNIYCTEDNIIHFPSRLWCFVTLFEFADFSLCRYLKKLSQIFLPKDLI